VGTEDRGKKCRKGSVEKENGVSLSACGEEWKGRREIEE
jgi:hypothetical protein